MLIKFKFSNNIQQIELGINTLHKYKSRLKIQFIYFKTILKRTNHRNSPKLCKNLARNKKTPTQMSVSV